MLHETAPETTQLPMLVVYAELPTPAQWVWVELFRIEVQQNDTITRLASGTPWRWIAFACGVILGTARGILSTSKTPVDNIDRDAPSFQHSLVYFHIPDDERNNLSTVEPGLCINREGSTHEREAKVRARDGACVCTGIAPMFCIAAHLIPHIKGDEYIQNLTKDRGDIQSINDERNVILLQSTLHEMFGKHFAIMPKPNFAFPDAPRSWEPHWLQPAGLFALRPYCTVPEDLNTWPPDLLFNHVYAAAVLFTFASPQSTRTALSSLSRRYLGPDGPLTAAQRVALHASEAKAAAQSTEFSHNTERNVRAERGHQPGGALEEIESFLPQWTILLPDEMRRSWCKSILHEREEAAQASRAENNARVSQWLLS